MVTRRTVLFVAVLLLNAGLATPARSGTTVDRLFGNDRFETAAAVSAATFEPGVEVAFVATGENFPDALAGGAAAGFAGAPVLLVQRDALPAPTAEELDRLAPQRIVVLGGAQAVSEGVREALAAHTDGEVQRLAGASRFETAAAISAASFEPGVSVAYVATGAGFADALAGGAAGAVNGGPVLLTERERLPADTAAELERLAPERIAVLGGEAAVDGAVLAEVAAFTDGDVVRLAGDDRYTTAVAISADTFDSATAVYLATGTGFPDALAGAPAAATEPAPLLLTRPECVPAPVLAEIDRLGAERVVVLGGPAAVSEDAAALTPCPAGDVPPPTFRVDPTVVPYLTSVPPLEDGIRRPVAAVVDQNGAQMDFVANEVAVATADEAALAAFLERWDGGIIAPEVPALGDAPPVYLVRIDPSGADTDAMSAAFRELDPLSRGDHRVSSETGLELLAVTASETAAGLLVGPNPIGRNTAAVDRNVVEAPAADAGIPYAPNAFTWDHLRDGGPTDMGVTEAWRALAMAAGPTGPRRVPVAVFDRGVAATNPDYPADVEQLGATGVNTIDGCGTDPNCRWHGTHVAHVVAAEANNGIGVAGVATAADARVAQLRLHGGAHTFFDTVYHLYAVALGGTPIATMSITGAVPATVGAVFFPYEGVFNYARLQGVLFFASAGNQHINDRAVSSNVDDEDCFALCWEEELFFPCEFGVVVCVGGIAPDRSRDPGSNFGTDDDDSSVDLYAPFTVFTGSDPDRPQNVVHTIPGTSFSTPYVAGVAALLKSADPTLGPADLERILVETSRPGLTEARRVVDAYAAMIRVLGAEPFDVHLTGPPTGTTVERGEVVAGRADVVDPDGGSVALTWTLDGAVLGTAGAGSTVQNVDTGPLATGEHTLCVEGRDATFREQECVVFTVVDSPPTIRIDAPTPGTEVALSQTFTLRGLTADGPRGTRLPDSAVEWRWGPNEGNPLRPSGHVHHDVRGDELGLGPKAISFVATDEAGNVARTAVTITVVEDPEDLPPSASILSPPSGEQPTDSSQGALVHFEGEASDPEDGALGGGSVVWRTDRDLDGDGAPDVLGTGLSFDARLGFEQGETETTHVVTMHVTDSYGNETVDSVTVTVVYVPG